MHLTVFNGAAILIADIEQNGRRANRPLGAGRAVLLQSGEEEAKRLRSRQLLESNPL